MEWILFSLCVIFLVILDCIKKNKLTYLSLFLLFLLIGFRYRLGWDFDNYTGFYEKPLETYLKDKYFINLMFYLNKNGFHSQMLFFVVNFIKISTIFYISNKMVQYRSLSVYLYFTITYFFGRDLSNLRQSLSESCFLWIFYFVIIKRKRMGFIFNFGNNFHNSLLPANIFLIGSCLNLSRKLRYFILLFSVIISFYMNEILSVILNLLSNTKLYKYNYYLSEQKFHKFLTPLSMCYMFLLILSSLYFIKNRVDIIQNVKLEKKVSGIYFCSLIYLILVINLQGPIARFSYYGLLLYIFLYPIHLEDIVQKKRNKYRAVIIVFLLVILLGYYVLFLGEFVFGEKEELSSSLNRVLRFKIRIFE